MATRAEIPHPKTLPIIGNLHQIPKAGLIQHLIDVARDFADPGIFKLFFGSYVSLWVSHPDLVAELCDETRFRKIPGPGLRSVRSFAGDGLFTAFSEEANWSRAHNILLPAFSQRAMRGYFDMMLEVSDAMVAKWAGRTGSDVNVPDDMTRFTLDSIAIAGFGYRFNSFEKDQLDPFLEALATALIECMNKTTRLPIQTRFDSKGKARLADAIATMNTLVDQVIAERRAKPTDEGDLLNLMLEASDPQSGEKLTDLNIRYQILTFLIAGHETTSGMLSFAFYHLLRSPYILAQAYAEVDRVLPGDKRPDYADIAKLDVIERILKETLRLWPTAPSFSVGPHADEMIGGRYLMRKDRPINVMTPALHRHPAVWERPLDFDIDRWLPEAEAKRHPHAYKPFGNGVRACIGRQFAMVEAKLGLAMLLQKFAISDRRDYALTIKETLSIKPDDFTMRIDARPAHTRLNIAAPVQSAANDDPAPLSAAGAGQRLSVIWGTSLGTARDIAEEIAERAEADGFEVRVRSMDEALGTIPDERIVIAVTATYNGKAPDSAVKAEAALDAGAFDGVDWGTTRFAVLGLGSSSWPNYQAFPKRVDAAFEATGAERLVPMGMADTEGDFDGAVGAFLSQLWASLGARGGDAKASGLSLTMVDTRDARAAVLPESAVPLEIVSNDELVGSPDGLFDTTQHNIRQSTRLIRVRLPAECRYATGDHLAIFARNPKDHVDRAIDRLGVPGAAQLVLSGASGRFRHLPLGRTVTVRQLLTDFVEIQDALPKRALEAAIAATRCPHTKTTLEGMAGDGWAETSESRLSLLGLLLKFPAIEMELEQFVELSSAIAPRFYSIASSPMVSPDVADLVVGTIKAPAWSGVGEHQGFASSHMRDLEPGEPVFGFVRSPNPPFAPPVDAGVPMILIGPGTGFAPFRGFLQERERQQQQGVATGPIHLFYGLKHPDHDWLCRDEMARWETSGLITLHLAQSAVADYPHRYVQHAIAAASDTVWPLIADNAQIYVCGDGRNMAPAVREALIDMAEAKTGQSRDAASDWLESLIDAGRYHQDVYGFGK
jgi:cytochrome P450 / NADPH-cytochrome P450 reductase